MICTLDEIIDIFKHLGKHYQYDQLALRPEKISKIKVSLAVLAVFLGRKL